MARTALTEAAHKHMAKINKRGKVKLIRENGRAKLSVEGWEFEDYQGFASALDEQDPFFRAFAKKYYFAADLTKTMHYLVSAKNWRIGERSIRSFQGEFSRHYNSIHSTYAHYTTDGEVILRLEDCLIWEDEGFNLEEFDLILQNCQENNGQGTDEFEGWSIVDTAAEPAIAVA